MLWCWEKEDKVFHKFNFQRQIWTRIETFFNEWPFKNNDIDLWGIGNILILWGWNQDLTFLVVDTKYHNDGIPLQFTECQQASTDNKTKRTLVSEIISVWPYLHSSSDSKVTFVGKTTPGLEDKDDPVWNFYTLSITLE